MCIHNHILCLCTYTYIFFFSHFVQDGFLSSLPFLIGFVVGVGSGFLADYLRRGFFSTTATRKIFNTAGKLHERGKKSIPSRTRLFCRCCCSGYFGQALAMALVGFAGEDKTVCVALLCTAVGIGGLTVRKGDWQTSSKIAILQTWFSFFFLERRRERQPHRHRPQLCRNPPGLHQHGRQLLRHHRPLRGRDHHQSSRELHRFFFLVRCRVPRKVVLNLPLIAFPQPDSAHWKTVFLIAALILAVGGSIFLTLASGEEQPFNETGRRPEPLLLSEDDRPETEEESHPPANPVV